MNHFETALEMEKLLKSKIDCENKIINFKKNLQKTSDEKKKLLTELAEKDGKLVKISASGHNSKDSLRLFEELLISQIDLSVVGTLTFFLFFFFYFGKKIVLRP